MRRTSRPGAGSGRTCLIGGSSSVEHPHAGLEDETSLSARTLLGTYETAPGSGRFRTFFATSGVGAAGPRPSGVSAQDLACDGPPSPCLRSSTVQTDPK